MRALRVTLVLALLLGLVYPLVMTAFATVIAPGRAAGSLVTDNGDVVGSRLIGQAWSGSDWFYGRPSAVDYDAATSAGSNLGPSNSDLTKAVDERAAFILKMEHPYNPSLTVGDIPADLLTSSASGLDPEISPASAALQAPRIAAMHGLSLAEVQSLIDENTDQRTFGVFGAPRVNVMELNLGLAARTS